MKIKVTKILGKNLKPGDLFSSEGKLYWSENNLKHHEVLGALGQKVYIRTNIPCPKNNEGVEIFRIEIIK